jgi:hypothetical protein
MFIYLVCIFFDRNIKKSYNATVFLIALGHILKTNMIGIGSESVIKLINFADVVHT